jgi:endonuclease-3
VEISGEVIKKSRSRANSPDYGYPVEGTAALTDKANTVNQRLTLKYGPARWSSKDPMSMLVDIILSHRTRDAQTAAAYAALKGRYASWEELRDAPVADVEATIQGVTWPEQKAPRLQAIMRKITAQQGNLNLDFLKEWPVERGVEYLSRFEGVGPKTRACVLLFSCRKPVLPVDTHVHRVSIRLGLIGPKVSAEAAHDLLQALLPGDAQAIYNFHKGLLRHGQQVCVYERPRCQQCILRDLCDYYQNKVLPGASPALA